MSALSPRLPPGRGDDSGNLTRVYEALRGQLGNEFFNDTQQKLKGTIRHSHSPIPAAVPPASAGRTRCDAGQLPGREGDPGF